MSNQHTYPPPKQPTPQPPPPSAINNVATQLVLWIARHWLALFTVAWGLYAFVPFLAPVLMNWGLVGPARLIYGLYSFTCHQLPHHSYFLFGQTPVPTVQELMAAGSGDANNVFLFRSFIGNAEVGYKVALCERDIAIYGSVFVASLIFALVRRHGKVRAPSLKVYALFLIPIAVDGFTQLIGWRESNWWLRTVTGAIFGMASVWIAYPYIEDAMNDVIETETRPRPTSSQPQG